jgi:hypothetical protein
LTVADNKTPVDSVSVIALVSVGFAGLVLAVAGFALKARRSAATEEVAVITPTMAQL